MFLKVEHGIWLMTKGVPNILCNKFLSCNYFLWTYRRLNITLRPCSYCGKFNHNYTNSYVNLLHNANLLCNHVCFQSSPKLYKTFYYFFSAQIHSFKNLATQKKHKDNLLVSCYLKHYVLIKISVYKCWASPIQDKRRMGKIRHWYCFFHLPLAH